MRPCLLFCLLIFSAQGLYAQKKLKEGFVHYQVTAVQNVDLMDNAVKQVVDKMGIKIYFKDNLMRSETNMGLQEVIFMENTDTRLIHVLMDMDNAKYAVRWTTDEMIAQKKNQGDYEHNIEYVDERKRISGYNCKLAILTFENKSQMFVYYTNKLMRANRNFTDSFYKLNGFPIRYTAYGPGGTELEYTAVQISNKINNPEILLIPSGYKETTMEQLQMMFMRNTTPERTY